MKGLCDALHGMGLKAGIYSTPVDHVVCQLPRRQRR